MSNIAEFLSGLSTSWKAVSALTGAAAAGFAIAVLLGGWTEIPELVEVNKEAITANTERIVDHTGADGLHEDLAHTVARGDSAIVGELNRVASEIRRTNCVLVALSDGVPFVSAIRECGL